MSERTGVGELIGDEPGPLVTGPLAAGLEPALGRDVLHQGLDDGKRDA